MSNALYIDSWVRYDGQAWEWIETMARRAGYGTLPVMSLGFVLKRARSIEDNGRGKKIVR